jgi:hypothetical protein
MEATTKAVIKQTGAMLNAIERTVVASTVRKIRTNCRG